MTCGGEKHLIDGCSEKMNVSELKVIIETVTKIPSWRQQLILELDVLADIMSLGMAGVSDSSKVTLVQKELDFALEQIGAEYWRSVNNPDLE